MDATPANSAAKSAAKSAARPPMADLRRADVWVFDLDNTLYPARCRLFDQVDWNITRYVSTLLDLPLDQARALQKTYFRQHGTTMRGLMTLHGVDPQHFLNAAHDIDLAPVDPAPALDAALAKLPGRKVIFTNGDVRHAERVTDKLGVRHHFEAVFDIVASDYDPKPAPHVYDKLCREHAIRPTRAVMIEDMARNLAPAHAMGMTTVWLRPLGGGDVTWATDGHDGGHIHHVIDDLVDWLEDVTAGLD
ncbi:MAG: pyrimidine 5'-nucleotidase [Rhodospirillaceae bacterium]